MNNRISQIYISDSQEIPNDILKCIATIKGYARGYKHHLLHNIEVRHFIKTNYDTEVLDAYDALKPYAYKADLARLCILKTYGGWYMDSTVQLQSPLPEVSSEVQMIVFRDAPNPGAGGNWNTNNGVIYSQKQEHVLTIAIAEIVENVRQKYYGATSLDPTGPGVLGRALAQAGPNRNIITGWYNPLTPLHQLKNYAYILPNGRILAYGKVTAGTPSGLGLAAYGDKGTNSYEQMYHARDIYK